ncbi:MAG: TraB/GumN family protein [Candidatus Thermoplasmatota archaeon]|nr:TraB/GumN family protein [Candidatus Thermoplasmatota archaeon]
MITLVGVGHVFNLQEAIEHILEERQPQCVALELDRNRYIALREKQTGKGGGMYGMLAKYQQKLAEDYGTTPGAEMLAAADKGKSIGADIALIDMDAYLVFQRLWKGMKLKERLYMFFGGFGSFFVRKKTMKRELEHLQQEPEAFMDELGKRLPTAKKILVDDRNAYMADQIRKLGQKYQRIVVFVGDGHIPGLDALLLEEKEIIRLRQLTEGNIPPPLHDVPKPPAVVLKDGGGAASITYGLE